MILKQKIIPILQQDRLKQLKFHRLRMEEPALHQTLLVLTLGSRIDYDTATHAKRRHTGFRIDHNRADGDVEDAITTGLQQSNRSGVSATWETLEFANDLHRANLRRARDRTAGKQRAHQVDQTRSVAQSRFHCRGHLPDSLEAFQIE